MFLECRQCGWRNVYTHSFSFTTSVLRHFRKLLALQAAWACLYAVFTFLPTLLLRAILQYVEHPKDSAKDEAWFCVLLLFVCSLVSAIAESCTVWIGQRIGVRLRAIMIGEMYTKALRSKATGSTSQLSAKRTTKPDFAQWLWRRCAKPWRRPPIDSSETSPLIPSESQADIGTIMNLLTTDVCKIADVGANMHQVWTSVPVQIVMTVALLYQKLGLSSFAGIALMAAMMPLNSYIAKQFGKIQMAVMAASDVRIQSTNEMVRNIRIIKFLAWEGQFQQSISEKRRVELRALRSRFILWLIVATTWYCVPLLITFLSFLAYSTLVHNALTPSVAFTALSLFNLLIVPLDDFV